MIKPFNKKLYNDNDPRSREVILNYYHKRGLLGLKENPDKYGIDLITDDGHWGIELERHGKWLGNKDYVYRDIHILSRKVHLFNNDKMNVVFVVLNNEYSKAAYLWKSIIQKYLTDDYIENLKCYVPGEGWRYDDVYNIPRHELGYIQF